MGHDEQDVDVSRRNLGALLGMLGGAAGLAALGACAGDAGAEGEPERTGAIAQALTGSNFIWVDTIVTDLRSLSSGSDDAGTSKPVAVVGGYRAPGDGGGGVFYWSSGGTDNGGTVIVPGGGVGSDAGAAGCWKRIYSGPLDVRWFGAIPNQTTVLADAGIAAAIAAAPTSSPGGRPTSGIVYFPAGTFTISTAIILGSCDGVILRGAGKMVTRIVAQTNLGGGPMIRLSNCRWCAIEQMWLFGFNSSNPPIGIQSFSEGTPSVPPTGLRVKEVLIGDPTNFGSTNIYMGIAFSTDGLNHNNDESVIEDVDIINYSQDAIYISHSTSVLHRIIGGVIGGPAAQRGVVVVGGSFTMVGTNFGPLGDTPVGQLFSFVAPSAGSYGHPSVITNVTYEAGAVGAEILGVASNVFGLNVFFSNCEFIGQVTSGGWLVDFEGGAPTGTDAGAQNDWACTASFTNCRLVTGPLLFLQPNSVGRFVNCQLQGTGGSSGKLVYNGYLILMGNTFEDGAPNLVPGSGATLSAHGNTLLGHVPAQFWNPYSVSNPAPAGS